MAMRSTVGEGHFNFRQQSQTFRVLQLERTPIDNLFNTDAIFDTRILMGVSVKFGKNFHSEFAKSEGNRWRL